MRTAVSSDHANSPYPSSREGHHSTTRWSSSFLLSDLNLHDFHVAAAACSRDQRNSVPLTQMRCMITASRRASATIAFFIPRRLANCVAHALCQDHFFECTSRPLTNSPERRWRAAHLPLKSAAASPRYFSACLSDHAHNRVQRREAAIALG
jgi:hypothetical protein